MGDHLRTIQKDFIYYCETSLLLCSKCRICYSTGCSLGKVGYSLENSQYLRTGGIYLMPETVPCNGIVVFVEMCAFFNLLMDTNLFRLTLGLFREGDDYLYLTSTYLSRSINTCQALLNACQALIA